MKSHFLSKFLLKTGHEGPEREQMYSSTLPSTSELDEVEWSTPLLGGFTPGKDPVPVVIRSDPLTITVMPTKI